MNKNIRRLVFIIAWAVCIIIMAVQAKGVLLMVVATVVFFAALKFFEWCDYQAEKRSINKLYKPVGNENKINVFMCGPSRANCKCECVSGGTCGHDFSQWKEYTDEYGCRVGTAVCSKCAMTAVDHDMWVMP